MKNSGAILARSDAVIQRMGRYVAATSGIALIGMMLLICTDVFLRFVFNAPLPAAVEGSELFMPYIVFFGFAYALSTGTHVRVTLVLNRLPPGAQSGADIVMGIAGLVFFSLLTIWGWQQFWESFVVREFMLAAVPLPWYVGKVAMPIGVFFISLQFLIMLSLHLARLLSKE